MSRSMADLVERGRHVRPLRTLAGHEGRINWVAWSPDSSRVVTASDDRTVRLWDPESGACVRSIDVPGSDVQGVTFVGNRKLASCSQGGRLQLWTLEPGQEAPRLEGHSRTVASIAASPSGRWLASASDDQTVGVWDVATGQLRSNLSGHTTNVHSVSWSADGRWLASGSWDRTVRVWHADTLELAFTWNIDGFVLALEFSPDGRHLAMGRTAGVVKVLEAGTWYELYEATCSGDRITGVSWSPDCSVLASRNANAADPVQFWDAETGQFLVALPQGPGTKDDWFLNRALAFSPDGRFLVTYDPSTTRALRIWDVSALDVGPKRRATPAPPPPRVVVRALAPHLATLACAHVAATLPPERLAAWQRGVATAGCVLPLGLVRDLGLMLALPEEQRQTGKPAHLPFDLDTSAYLAFLHRLAAHPLVRELPTWRPALSDAALAVVLVRLAEGLDFPAVYRVSPGPAAVLFAQLLSKALADADPARLWRETAADQRPDWTELLPAAVLARIEANLAALDRNELRFLARYGPALAGAPGPQELVDLLALTGLPAAARLAVSQGLRLLPRLNTNSSRGSVQTYPEGGYEGLARTGSLDSLLPTEAAYPRPLFLHRVLNGEALYYGRERPREKRKELAFVVTQLGPGLGGDGEVLARAALLALGRSLAGQGHEVWYSFAGPELSEPRPLSRPGELARVLYHREDGAAVPGRVLGSVLRRLKGWRDSYRGRQVFWVVGEHFDADHLDEHAPLYHGLRAETPQHAWFVRVGRPDGAGARPAAARYFERWQWLDSACLWTQDHFDTVRRHSTPPS
jgi:hypothetical protein